MLDPQHGLGPIERRQGDRRVRQVPVPVERRGLDRREAARLAPPAAAATLRASVIDAWPLVRAGISATIADLGGVVAAASANTGNALADEGHFDLVVVGVPGDRKPGEAVRAARGRTPVPRVVVLLDAPDPAIVRDVVAAGADGVLERLVDQVDLRAAILRVLAGERVLSGGAVTLLAIAGLRDGAEALPVARNDLLTGKEREILLELARGGTNRTIAGRLHISEATVKTHLSNLYAKLGVVARHDAVAAAASRGILR